MIPRVRNDLTTHGDTIIGTIVIVEVSNEDTRGISNAALSIRVVLARTPLPDLSIVNVSFARRMFEAQESTGENRDRVL